jgi:hypothetical protein
VKPETACGDDNNLPQTGLCSNLFTFTCAPTPMCNRPHAASRSGDASICPAVVKSVDGDTYEMSGAGTLPMPGKSLTAAGPFTPKSTDGVMLEAGVWIGSELVLPMFSCYTSAGCLAVLRIRLLPVLGSAKNATLQVNRALGKVPDEPSQDHRRAPDPF